MTYDVFISYASQDKAVANAVCGVLEGRNIRCWIAPRDVQPGQPYGEAIIDAIHGCRIMVLVFSSNANASGHIPKEVERAVSRGATIIPLRIEDVAPGRSLDYFIGSVHWLDAMAPPLENHLANLADTIEKILPGRSTGVAGVPAAIKSAPPARIAAAAKPLPTPAEKRPSAPSWVYGGAGAAIAVAVILGFLLWKQKTPEQVIVLPSPSGATAQGTLPGSPPAVTVTDGPVTSPPAGNVGSAVAPGVPPNIPANSIPPGPSAISPGPGNAQALLNQALNYRDKMQDYDLAIRDFDQAIRAQPDFPAAFADRGDTYLFKGDFSRAIEDWGQVIHLDPNYASAFHRRGIIRLFLRQYQSAQEDIRQALESTQPNPDRDFDPIWLYLAQAKGGQNGKSDLQKYSARLNMTLWPGPVTRLFLSTAAPQDVIAAAKQGDSQTSARQLCQAYYFIGEYDLLGGQRANAAQLFQQSVATEQTRQFAYLGAKSELSHP